MSGAQTITFSGSDDENTVEINSKDIVVTTSAGSHDHGSSKIKLRNIVDFNWENRRYSGQLLAVHMGGKFLAYGIKVSNPSNPSALNGMVRVAHRTLEQRSLLKGMHGQVQDLAFAHIESQVILASIDEEGTIFIHEIILRDNVITHQLLLQVSNNSGGPGAEYRVVWCPYLPDEEEDVDETSSEDDGAKLLVTTHGNKVCVWNISQLAARYGPGPHSAAMLSEFTLTIEEHAAPVLDAAFSPDGSALATASKDGYVMFFQVYLHDEDSPRCLHKWQPHDGKPLSCLFFLDNHKNYNVDEQFWKFAVTGAKNNTLLKIWSCKTWSCLQTITFAPSIDTELAGNFGLKAGLDSTATYLLLSDVKRRALYVLQMTRDSDDLNAYCKNISEFLLPYPVLSFGIIDAGLQALKCPSSCADPYHRSLSSQDSDSPVNHIETDNNDNDELIMNGQAENGSIESCNIKTVIRLFLVQPKSLQEGNITYEIPHSSDSRPFELGKATDLNSFAEGLTDLPRDVEKVHNENHIESGKTTIKESKTSEPDATILAQQSQQLKNLLLRSQVQANNLLSGTRPDSPPQTQQLNLMTPDAFSSAAVYISSPVKNEDEDPPLTTSSETTPLPHVSTPMPSAPSLPTTVAPITDSDDLDVEGGNSPRACSQEVPAISLPTKNAAEISGHSYTTFGEGLMHNKSKQASETVWPSINMVKINEANQRRASSEKAAHKSKNNSLSSELENSISEAPNNRISTGHERSSSGGSVITLSTDDKASLKLLNLKLGRLIDMMSEQKDEINTLHGELAALRRAQSVMAAKSDLPAEEATEEILKKQYEQFKVLLEENITARWDATCSTAAAHAARSAGLGAARALEPVARALQNELAVKLTATDTLLRDNIQKLVNSKSITDALSASVTHSLQTMVKDAFREAIQTSLVPSMEKTQTQMFKQINHAFQNGVKEFISAMELSARGAVEKGTQSASSQLQLALEQHSDAIKRLPVTPPAPPPVSTSALSEVIKTVMEQEFGRWNEKLCDSESSRTPRTSSPNSITQKLDPQVQQSHITNLLTSGRINSAFQLALSASDLRLVVYTCNMADINAVFTPCQLQQHVLLSLIQQLSADMTANTLLKQKYLQEAVMNLDTKNAITREHLPVVTRELHNQLTLFITTNPNHPLSKEFKILLLLTEGLMKS